MCTCPCTGWGILGLQFMEYAPVVDQRPASMPHTNNSPMVPGGCRPQIMYQHFGSTHSWMQNAPGFVRQDAMMPLIGYGIYPAVAHSPVPMQPVYTLPIPTGSGGALYKIQNTGLMQQHAMKPSVFPPTASNQFSLHDARYALPLYFQPTQYVQQNQGFVAQPGSVVMPSQQPHGVKGRKRRILRIEDPTSGEDLTESIIRDSAVDAPVSSQVTSAGSASAPLQYKNPESHEQQKKRCIKAEFLRMVYQKASEGNSGESEGLPQDTAMQPDAVMMVQRKTSSVTTALIETAQISTPLVTIEEPPAEVSPAAAHMEVPKVAPGTAKDENAEAAKEPVVSPTVLASKSEGNERQQSKKRHKLDKKPVKHDMCEALRPAEGEETEPTMPTAEHNQDLKEVIHPTVPCTGEGKVEQSNKQEEVIIENVVESEKSIVTEEGTTVESEKKAVNVPVEQAAGLVVRKQVLGFKEPEMLKPSAVLPKKETKMNNVAEPTSPASFSLDSEKKVPKEKAKGKKLEDQNIKNEEGEPKPQDDKIGFEYTNREDHLSPCNQGGKKQSDQDFPAQIQPDCTSKTTGLPDTNNTLPKKNGASSTTVPLLSWKGIFLLQDLLSHPMLLSCVTLLLSLLPSSSASNTVECMAVQYAPLSGRAVVRCDGIGNFPLIYWFNNIEDDATAFIQKVNGEVTGSGYRAGEYNIDNEGSLVIYNVTLRDDRTFRVRVLDSDLIESSDDITLIVYVEPAEPLPVIPECSGQSTCILKGESDRIISCIHGQSRPAMEVSWFLRVGREDQPLNATVNQMVSADAVTVTTSAQLAINKIPIDANMNQLLVLVCKSVQAIPGMKGTERKILLDNSVDDPFTNVANLDPAYAFEREEDFKIKCQSEIDTTNNVVRWMYKALISEDFEYILYSAYGEVAFTTKGEAGFNITDDGALVIKEVHRQHEGYYACVSSLATTFVKNLEVIVQPKPPRIVVQGCEPFQPCHLSAQEAETITCTVNGVRPQVDLSIVTYSMNVAVTNTAVNSHQAGGLFYTTVEGHVDVSKVTCEENHVTLICQARGTAAYGFMSDAYIIIPVGGDDCAKTLTDLLNPDDDGSDNYSLALLLLCLLAVLITLSVPMIWFLKVVRGQCFPHHEVTSQKTNIEISTFSSGERESYLLPIQGGSKSES